MSSYCLVISRKHPYYRCKSKSCVVGNKSIRKDEIEDRFEKLLNNIAPTPEALNLTKALFEKRWNKKMSELSQCSKGDEMRLDEVKQSIESLSLRAARAQNDTLAEVYEKQIEKLANEELLLREKLGKQIITRDDFGTALEEVFMVLKSPYDYWVSGEINSKRLALRLVFADQIAYSTKSGFGTPELALPVRVFELVATNKSRDVEVSGKTLNRLKTYLERFWMFYKSCPNLQNHLANA